MKCQINVDEQCFHLCDVHWAYYVLRICCRVSPNIGLW